MTDIARLPQTARRHFFDSYRQMPLMISFYTSPYAWRHNAQLSRTMPPVFAITHMPCTPHNITLPGQAQGYFLTAGRLRRRVTSPSLLRYAIDFPLLYFDENKSRPATSGPHRAAPTLRGASRRLVARAMPRISFLASFTSHDTPLRHAPDDIAACHEQGASTCARLWAGAIDFDFGRR